MMILDLVPISLYGWNPFKVAKKDGVMGFHFLSQYKFYWSSRMMTNDIASSKKTHILLM